MKTRAVVNKLWDNVIEPRPYLETAFRVGTLQPRTLSSLPALNPWAVLCICNTSREFSVSSPFSEDDLYYEFKHKIAYQLYFGQVLATSWTSKKTRCYKIRAYFLMVHTACIAMWNKRQTRGTRANSSHPRPRHTGPEPPSPKPLISNQRTEATCFKRPCGHALSKRWDFLWIFMKRHLQGMLLSFLYFYLYVFSLHLFFFPLHLSGSWEHQERVTFSKKPLWSTIYASVKNKMHMDPGYHMKKSSQYGQPGIDPFFWTLPDLPESGASIDTPWSSFFF